MRDARWPACRNPSHAVDTWSEGRGRVDDGRGRASSPRSRDALASSGLLILVVVGWRLGLGARLRCVRATLVRAPGIRLRHFLFVRGRAVARPTPRPPGRADHCHHQPHHRKRPPEYHYGPTVLLYSWIIL